MRLVKVFFFVEQPPRKNKKANISVPLTASSTLSVPTISGPHLSVRSAQTLDAAGQARLRRLLRWRDAEARRSDRPKNWVLDNELAVQLSRRAVDNFPAFNALLEANPKSPRRAPPSGYHRQGYPAFWLHA